MFLCRGKCMARCHKRQIKQGTKRVLTETTSLDHLPACMCNCQCLFRYTFIFRAFLFPLTLTIIVCYLLRVYLCSKSDLYI